MFPFIQFSFPFVEGELDKYLREHKDLSRNLTHKNLGDKISFNNRLRIEEIVGEILTEQFLQVKASKHLHYNSSDCLVEMCRLLFKGKEDEIKTKMKKLSTKRKVKILRHNVFGQLMNEKGEVGGHNG